MIMTELNSIPERKTEMAYCATLAPVIRQTVDFDVTNPEHLRAFKMLCIGENKSDAVVIRQHPTLRFNLEHPFTNVRSMMIHKVGVHYVNSMLQK